MKVCLAHSLEQFEDSCQAKLLLNSVIKVRLDAFPSKDVDYIDNVANCHDGNGRSGKYWSKDEDQKFLALGRVLITIRSYSKANIGKSHGDKDDTKDNGAPYRVAIVNEGDPVVNVGTNVEQEEPKIW